MKYNFFQFNPYDFETLVQSLMQNVLGNNSIVFGSGPDGARELTFTGSSIFPNMVNSWKGYWVIQAKFKSQQTILDDYSWTRKFLKNELKKFKNTSLKTPDNYIFLTNAKLSSKLKIGGRDRIEELLNQYKSIIPNIYVASYDELCSFIDNNSSVRRAYSHLFTSGDVLNEFLEKLKLSDPIIKEFEIRERYMYYNPNNIAKYVAIDFGSSYSLISYLSKDNKLTLVPSYRNQVLVPTCITFFENGTYIVGRPEYKFIKDSVTVENFKRELGNNKFYDVFNQQYSVEYISTLFLKSLRSNINDYFSIDINKALISRPSNFGIRQTNELYRVFNQAGFEVFRVVSESSASALNIEQQALLKSMNQNIISFLSIDLGGGTFDASLIYFGDGVYEISESIGDNYLGGFDYDSAIYEYCLNELSANKIHLSYNDSSKLLFECQRIKKELSKSDSSIIILRDLETEHGNLYDYEIVISKCLFSKLTAQLNNKIENYLTKLCSIQDIDLVLISGQGAKIFTVSQIINEMFPNVPIIADFVENSVVRGLTEYTGVLDGRIDNKLLLDTLDSTIGIKCVDVSYSLEKNIHNQFIKSIIGGVISTVTSENESLLPLADINSTIPTKKTYNLRIQNIHKKKNLKIVFFERDLYENNFDLGFYVIPIQNSTTQLSVTIDIDASSIIDIVLKTNDTSNQEVTVRINSYYRDYKNSSYETLTVSSS